MTQLSMEEILQDESSPDAELAKEMMGPDERAALDDARAAAKGETGERETAAPAEPEQTSESEGAEAKAEPDDTSDLPEFIRRTLEAKPDDAENWRNLRGIAKDAQKATRAAAEESAALKAEKARLEAELAALRAQPVQAPQPQPTTPQPQIPDPDVDPAGYARALVAQETERLRVEMRDQQLNAFEVNAVRAHGKQAVDEAFVWATEAAKADPSLQAQLQSAVDPWEFVVQEKRRRETFAQMGDDPLAYIEEQKRAAVAAALEAARTAAGQSTEAAVEAELAKRLPRSMAKVPGAGGQAVSDGYAGPPSMDQILGGNSG